MAALRVKRAGFTVVIVVVSALVGAVLGGAQSSFPIRLDDPPKLIDDADVKPSFIVWTGEVSDATELVILQADTLSTVVGEGHRVNVQVGINPSTGTSTATSFSRSYDGLTSVDIDDLRFELESDGSFTVRRVAGTKTYSIVVYGVYA